MNDTMIKENIRMKYYQLKKCRNKKGKYASLSAYRLPNECNTLISINLKIKLSIS